MHRRMTYRVGPDFFELVPSQRPRRGLATINVGYEDKAVFDAIQWWLAHHLGREVSQWDVFSYLLGESLGNEASALRRARLFPEERERKP